MSDRPAQIAFRTTLRLGPGELVSFLRWKDAEASVLADQPGYRGHLVFEEREQPGLVHYVSQWSAKQDTATAQEDPRYRDVAAEHGVALFPPDVRDGLASPESVGYESRFHILDRQSGRVLVSEGHVDRRTPPHGSFVFIYDVDVGDGGGEAYERFKIAESEGQLIAPGFYYRILFRHEQHPTVYTYLSVWDSREAANAFHDRFVNSDVYRETYGALQPFRGSPDFKDCSLLGQTVLRPRPVADGR